MKKFTLMFVLLLLVPVLTVSALMCADGFCAALNEVQSVEVSPTVTEWSYTYAVTQAVDADALSHFTVALDTCVVDPTLEATTLVCDDNGCVESVCSVSVGPDPTSGLSGPKWEDCALELTGAQVQYFTFSFFAHPDAIADSQGEAATTAAVKYGDAVTLLDLTGPICTDATAVSITELQYSTNLGAALFWVAFIGFLGAYSLRRLRWG